tara:strand:+ start:2969 stop:3160 length:192 start_codon:yes stop_codon:yes gene_type:complete
MSKESQHPPLGDIPEMLAFEIVAKGFGAIPVIGPTIQTVLNKSISEKARKCSWAFQPRNELRR